MSKNLSSVAIQEFDAEVKHAYQQGGKLRPAVTVRSGVTGNAYKFTRMGKGMANQKATQADVTPMDVSHARQTATLQNWTAPEYTDIFDAAEVNFDEKQELAGTIAKALARREDQLIIDSMLSGTITYTAIASITASTSADNGTTIAAGGTGFTVDKLLQASKALNQRGVDQEDRHVACSADNLYDMLGETEVGSIDYNNVKALVRGDIDTFIGFKFHMIEDRNEGGLPANIAYAWQKSAVGLAVGLDQMTEVNYVPTKTSWLCTGVMKAGAVVREGAGVVEINVA